MMEILRCLLLPIREKTLIVPYSAVAEVVPYKDEQASLQDVKASHKWNWRGIEIPLIFLEKQEKPDLKREIPPVLHVAILNRCVALKGPDFLGLMLQALPSMSRCKRSDMQAVTVSDKPYLSAELKIRGKTVFIPNLAWMWENLSYFDSRSAS